MGDEWGCRSWLRQATASGMARARASALAKVRLASRCCLRSRQHRSMSFSSGAYFGSHSRVSQVRSASARGQLAAVDWSVVEDRDQGPGAFGGAVGGGELIEQGDKVGGALGGAGVYEKVPMHRIKGPKPGLFLCLAGGLDAQLGAAPSPAARQIRVRERLGFVEKHQVDCP